MGNWYSLETEIRMGKEYSQQVEASVKMVQDPVVTEYVNRIGQKPRSELRRPGALQLSKVIDFRRSLMRSLFPADSST